MYLSLKEIVKNKDLVKINIWDNDLIVYKCGYVFKKDKHRNKWKIMNFVKYKTYKSIKLINKGITKNFSIHRLVYYAFNQSTFDIFNSSKDNSIDHINGNTLDNRLSNLRNVTHQQNHFNEKKCKGYCYDPRKKVKKYASQIRYNGKTIHLGMYKTKEEAKAKYIIAKHFYHKI